MGEFFIWPINSMVVKYKSECTLQHLYNPKRYTVENRIVETVSSTHRMLAFKYYFSLGWQSMPDMILVIQSSGRPDAQWNV